jgi:hypothetical protein
MPKIGSGGVVLIQPFEIKEIFDYFFFDSSQIFMNALQYKTIKLQK